MKSRKPATIRKSEAAEIARIRKNYQAKIKRLELRGIYTPRISILGTETREELNAKKEAMIKLDARTYNYQPINIGSETDPFLVTRQTATQLRKRQKEVSTLYAQRDDELEKMKYKYIAEDDESEGIVSHRRVPGQGKVSIKRKRKHFVKEEFSDPEELDRYMDMMDKAEENLHKSDLQLKENIIKAIERVFGVDESKEIVDFLSQMSAEQVIVLNEMTDLFKLVMMDSDNGVGYWGGSNGIPLSDGITAIENILDINPRK